MLPNSKIIFSIVIPMYNGEPFIDNCLHSVLNEQTFEAGVLNFIEIIIINDGSKDNGASKAKEWAKKWNTKLGKKFITIINKENGQYGSVINRGIVEAKGKYIKVLDVDDIFNTRHFIEIIQIIASIRIDVDVIVTDYIFDKVIKNKQIVYKWDKYFEPYKIIKMSEAKYPNSIITMHSLIYRTELLRSINYKQVEGIYYSDSQYSVVPFSQAKLLYYINIPLYRYYIGRNDQSINIKTMVKNREHQKKVMEVIFHELFNITTNSTRQKKYAWRVAKNMFEWQMMIVSYDTSIKNRGKHIYDSLQSALKECKANNNFFAFEILKNGILSRLIKITRGHGIIYLMRIGEKLYAKYKLNIMADWD
ncbi:MAG: glycosyltransferase [Mycoplasma sp.]|nr:glycosyltransferase [Mycoplasma sp.]